MLAVPLRAKDCRIISFQAGYEGDIDKQVNEWLQKQSPDTVIYHMMFGHSLAASDNELGWSYSIAIAYGVKPTPQSNNV